MNLLLIQSAKSTIPTFSNQRTIGTRLARISVTAITQITIHLRLHNDIKTPSFLVAAREYSATGEEAQDLSCSFDE